MRPIRTKDCNFTFLGPNLQVADLPCRRSDEGVYATFELTDRERELVAAGGTVRLGLHTQVIPPVSFKVELAVPEWKPDDLRCPGCKAIYVKGRGINVCGQCGSGLLAAGDVE